MATIRKLSSGNWRVQVRRKGRYIGETFRRHKDAETWALDVERRIDRGETPSPRARVAPTTFGHLVELHVQDMLEVGKAPRRSKAASLDALKIKLGKVGLRDLSRERLIQFGHCACLREGSPETDGPSRGSSQARRRDVAVVHVFNQVLR